MPNVSIAESFSRSTLSAWNEASMGSPETILPLVFALSRPESVIDVGCLYGGWAETCRELGVNHVVGVDGDYVDRTALLIPQDSFLVHDLATPLSIDRTFDLAISLEVAHYFPESRAAGFVADLCALAPLVLFAAAIPHQGGTRHLNEQWPAYWVQRFASNGYTPVDCIRDEIWDDPAVAWWYKQNTILFVANSVCDSAITEHRGFGRAAERIHPNPYLRYAEGRYQELRRRADAWLDQMRRLRMAVRARRVRARM